MFDHNQELPARNMILHIQDVINRMEGDVTGQLVIDHIFADEAQILADVPGCTLGAVSVGGFCNLLIELQTFNIIKLYENASTDLTLIEFVNILRKSS